MGFAVRVSGLGHRKRRRGPVGVSGGVLGEIGLDLGEPLVEQLLGPRVERREGADDARLRAYRAPTWREHERAHACTGTNSTHALT